MARPVFWPTNDSYVLSVGGNPQAGIPVRVYANQTGGSPITDLQYVNASGTPTGAVASGILISDGNGLLPPFAGPDSGPTTLWGDHGMSGERLALTCSPGSSVAGVSSVVGLSGAVTGPQILADSTVSSAVGGTVVAAKTANYTAAPGETVPVDATSGPLTITLPAASRARDRVVVKKVDSTSNAVTVTRAGSDVINVSATTLTLALQYQSTVLRSTGSGVWIVEAGDLPYGALTTALTGTLGPGGTAGNINVATAAGAAAGLALALGGI